MMRKMAYCALVALAVVSVASAEQFVDQTRPAAADGVVAVELISGKVQAIGWERNEVQVKGSLGEDVEELAITTRGDRISIEVVLPKGRRSLNDADADLEIYLPAGGTFEAESVSADISVESMTGSAEVESVSGEVTIKSGLQELEVGTVSGRIRLTTLEPLREGELESVSGEIEVRGALAPSGDFSFETVSGDIELHVPASLSADFKVETFSGKIKNELGPPAERSSETVPGKTLRFSVGGGGAQVEVESFSGSINIRAD